MWCLSHWGSDSRGPPPSGLTWGVAAGRAWPWMTFQVAPPQLQPPGRSLPAHPTPLIVFKWCLSLNRPEWEVLTVSGGPMTSAPCVLRVLWGEGASLSWSCRSAPGAGGGGRGVAAPGYVLTEALFLWTSLSSLLYPPWKLRSHSIGAPLAPGPTLGNFSEVGTRPLCDAQGLGCLIPGRALDSANYHLGSPTHPPGKGPFDSRAPRPSTTFDPDCRVRDAETASQKSLKLLYSGLVMMKDAVKLSKDRCGAKTSLLGCSSPGSPPES